MPKKSIGYVQEDYATAYAKYYNETIEAVPIDVENVFRCSPLPVGSLPPFSEAHRLQDIGYADVETGYTCESDGAIRVAVLTHMPNVSPEMWDWWFGWHGCQDNRYKIWHPKAHISAHWEDGKNDIRYIGRNSIIAEYIGNELTEGAIQFKSPTAFGFSEETITDQSKAVYICAKIGHPSLPVDYGYLVHQIRRVEGGAEMRSRFWLGGQYIELRKKNKMAKVIASFIQKMKTLNEEFAKNLLLHCSEEMTHLASFLPQIYTEFTPKIDKIKVIGRVIDQTDDDFENIILSTLFNKVVPNSRPCQIVEPKSVKDIIETINFAKAHHKKITVCSGGHSWSANHLRDNSILIMMKNFNAYEINAPAMTAKAGPGVGGSILMSALYKQKLFFPAGHCKGVCIGGYLLQGGYGWNGRKTGIACQSVIGLDIVTADGELVHANENENADLFWAARGSGGGFFGIVVCFHLKLFKLPTHRAIIVHDFHIKHLEHVYNWAYEVGPSVPKAVEFQMLMSNKMLNLLGPGIEAVAPIFADTKEEFEEAMAFMKNSPIKNKAIIATPAFNPGINALYKSVMTHYPENRYWGVDNMWTHAPIADLMPYIHQIAKTLPPAPSHFLWLNWYPNSLEKDMAYSKEDEIYWALYANWKNSQDSTKYGDWAKNMMQDMAHLSTGIQLADEGLHKRTAPFLSDTNLKKIQDIRAVRDPQGIFYEWHSKPDIQSNAQ